MKAEYDTGYYKMFPVTHAEKPLVSINLLVTIQKDFN
jgi:hypothetical protein